MASNTLTAPVIYLLTIIFLLVVSAIAFAKVPKGSRLPMQWGFGGQVNWSAPAKWAVLITPALAVFTIGALGLADALGLLLDDESNSAPALVYTVAALIVSVAFILMHIGHLYLAVRHVRKG